MPQDRPNSRFTLINLLAVIGFISVLFALLLPALPSSRGASRRGQCSRNLKQLGIALHNYASLMGSFPSGISYGTYDDVPDFAKGNFGKVRFYNNAFTSLLPHIEEQKTADPFDPNQPWYRQSPGYAAAPLRALTCPSNYHKENPLAEDYFSQFLPAMEGWFDEPFTVGPNFGRTDYLLCKGVSDAFCPRSGLVRTWTRINANPNLGGFADNERGMFDLSMPAESAAPGSSFACTTAMIRDGMSNTFAVGEGAQGPDWQICRRGLKATGEECQALCWDGVGEPVPCSDGTAKTPLPIYQFWVGSPNVSAGARGGLYMGSILGCTLEPLNKNPVIHTIMRTEPFAAMNCRASIDWDGDGPVNANTEIGVDRVSNFRSNHPGGANFLMADGSVLFVTESIDRQAYRALSTIAGSEFTVAGN